jgi:hypothetical protein
LNSGEVLEKGPEWHREQECIYWPDINGFKIGRQKAGRAMETLLARTSKDFQFSIRRQPAGGTQARHRKKRKEMVQE